MGMAVAMLPVVVTADALLKPEGVTPTHLLYLTTATAKRERRVIAAL